MILDNHMVSEGDKELDKKGGCPSCGRLMALVDWCEDAREKCTYCKGDDESTDCVNHIEKNYCRHCEIAVDID